MCAKLLDVTTRYPRTRHQILPAALFALLLAPLWAGPTTAQQAATSSAEKHPCGHGNQPACPPPTLTLTFNPQLPSIPSSTPLGTVVATATAAWSDGSAFTGTITLSVDDGGTFALSCTQCATTNIVVNPLGLGVSADGGTVQTITVTAMQ